MTTNDIAKAYLEYLETANTEAVISLFADDGIVESPLYGTQTASDFYKILSDDTANSSLTLQGIFNTEMSKTIALYFTYQWTLKSGKIVTFDVVDIIEFNDDLKIKSLKIIYDTVIARQLQAEL